MSEGLGAAQEKPIRSYDALRCFGVAAAANGAVDTAVIRFTAANITLGSSFTVVETANEGTVLTCVRGGMWSLSLYAALVGAGNLQVAIGVNAADAGAFTNPPITFVAVDAGAGTMGIVCLAGDTNIAADGPHVLQCSRIMRLVPTDTIRFYATVAVTTNANNTRFNLDPVILD